MPPRPSTPPTVARKVECAALVYSVGEEGKEHTRVAVHGEVVELPDDEITRARTESGLLGDPHAGLNVAAALADELGLAAGH